jgi:hypothetical protein
LTSKVKHKDLTTKRHQYTIRQIDAERQKIFMKHWAKIHKDIGRDGYTQRQIDRQTDRQTGRKIDSFRDRQTDRPRDGHN